MNANDREIPYKLVTERNVSTLSYDGEKQLICNNDDLLLDSEVSEYGPYLMSQYPTGIDNIKPFVSVDKMLVRKCTPIPDQLEVHKFVYFPSWASNETYQAVARAVRTESHNHLLLEDDSTKVV